MEISEQNSLRVLLLAIALTILGGATGIMFYAAQQNETVLASESELLAIRNSCPTGFHYINGTCTPDTAEPTIEDNCTASGEVWNSETKKCEKIENSPTCTDTQILIDNECVEKSTYCAKKGGIWDNGECIHCNDGETVVDGTCVDKRRLDCEKKNGDWDKVKEVCNEKCTDGTTLVDGICVDKRKIDCEENGMDWDEKAEKCNPRCTDGSTLVDGICIDKRRLDCEEKNGVWDKVKEVCNEKCTDGSVLTDEGCVDKSKFDCEENGNRWVEGKCVTPEKDTDGDGISDEEDNDIDGDGYIDKYDLDKYNYNVGDRDLLMFATLAYEPVSASQDRIAGDTVTENSKTVAQNYYDNNETEPEDTAGSGYPDYFNYVCNGSRAIEQTAWNVARDGENPCMIKEDEMIGMQAQSYSTLDTFIDAWQTTGKDFYFGNDGGIKGGVNKEDKNLKVSEVDENGKEKEKIFYRGYAGVEEVNQWIIVDHSYKEVTSSKRGGRMEATVFRLNNNFVIAYRGTDFTDLMEWFKNLTLATNQIKGYEEAAADYARLIVDTYSAEYFENPELYLEKYGGEPNFYITGHSLGGYLAQIGALGVIDSNINGKDFLRDVVYFNGMGIGIWGAGRNDDFDRLLKWSQQTDSNGALLHKVMCYYNYGDLVSALGRHVNQTGYYVADGAIKYHAVNHVAKLQNATRLELADGLVNSIFNTLGKSLGDSGLMYNRLDEVKEYLEYYRGVYDNYFRTKHGLPGSISLLDLIWFSHEPSASLFYNISQGERGYEENIYITSTNSKNTTTLTAEINSDVESYSWYKDGQLVGNGRSYRLILNDENTGAYTVESSIIGRASNSFVDRRFISSNEPIYIDGVAPKINITTENGTRNAQSGETVNFVVRATDKSGFSDGDLTESELSISGTVPAKNISIGTPVLSEDSSDNTKIWIVPVSSSTAGTIVLKVNEGAFKDSSGIESDSVKSPTLTFTIFEYKKEDKTKPSIKISALTANEAIKGEGLRFKIEGYDESGFESGLSNVDLDNNIDFSCTVGTPEYNTGYVTYSSDAKTVWAIVSVTCKDTSSVTSYGYIKVKSGAFVDANGNYNNQKIYNSKIKFTAEPDLTAPYIKIAPVDGWKTSYGGTLKYTVSINDDSGISINDSTLYDNIEVLGINNGISVDVLGVAYNENKTSVVYDVIAYSNENCSKTLGCSGTFIIKEGAFKDNAGNESKKKISGNIVFSSERDIVAPIVQIIPEGARSVEVGGSLSFKIIAQDAGGIDTSTTLKPEDFIVEGDSEGSASIVDVSQPTYNSNYTRVDYVVVIKGESVSSNTRIVLKNGAIKDNAGNTNSTSYSDIIMFIKRRDLTSPIVTIEPVTNWNTLRGEEIKFIVTAKDEGGISKNKTLTESSFYMTKVISNDAKVTKVSEPTYSEDGTEASYTVTVTATKAGKANLSVKAGAFRDTSNNLSLLKLSSVITFEEIKDNEPPKVSIKSIGSTSVKQGGSIQLEIVVTDNRGLVNPTLNLGKISFMGSNDFTATAKLQSKTNTEAHYIVTVKCSGSFGFLQLVKDGVLVISKGAFTDGTNESPRTTSSLLKFTKY